MASPSRRKAVAITSLVILSGVACFCYFTGWFSVFLYLMGWSSVRVNASVVNEIHPGMTESEVRAIVGGPPGNYQNQSYSKDDAVGTWVGSTNSKKSIRWVGSEGILWVVIGQDDRVMYAVFHPWETQKNPTTSMQ
jgi:hypothetical protein